MSGFDISLNWYFQKDLSYQRKTPLAAISACFVYFQAKHFCSAAFCKVN